MMENSVTHYDETFAIRQQIGDDEVKQIWSKCFPVKFGFMVLWAKNDQVAQFEPVLDGYRAIAKAFC